MNSNEQVMNGLLGKVFSVMASSDSANPQQPARDVFISYAAPGIPLSPEDLNFGDLDTPQKIARQAAFSYLVNTIPSTTGFWSSTGKMTWDIYRRAITDIRLSKSAISDDEQKLLKKCHNYLEKVQTRTDDDGNVTKKTVPSDEVREYNAYMAKYEDALLDYNSLLISAMQDEADPKDVKNFNLNGPTYKRRLINAYEQWEAEGNKAEVEKKRATISMLNGRGNEQVYNELKAKLEINRREDMRLGTYFPTYYFPDNALTGNSWTKVTFRENEIHSFSTADKKSFGGGVSQKWLFGLFSVGASASYSESSAHMKCDTSGLDVSFEVTQLPVLRPWFDASIFDSRNWKWADNNPSMISDGSNPPSGMMPAFASSVIVARNLSIKMDTSSEDNQEFFRASSGQASVGWGPFSLRGSGSQSFSRTSHDFKSTSTGISCPGMQIIGFMCNKLSKCPNPDQTLIW